jgi:hypothetical protein
MGVWNTKEVVSMKEIGTVTDVLVEELLNIVTAVNTKATGNITEKMDME